MSTQTRRLPTAPSNLTSVRTAYAVAVAGALTSAFITYLFVRPESPAYEGAPAMYYIITHFGWEGMLAAKGVALVSLYGVLLPYTVASRREAFESVTPRFGKGIAWLFALLCAGNAAWDLSHTHGFSTATLTLTPTAFALTLLVLLVVLVATTPSRSIDRSARND